MTPFEMKAFGREYVAANKKMRADLADVLYLFSLVARALSRPHQTAFK